MAATTTPSRPKRKVSRSPWAKWVPYDKADILGRKVWICGRGEFSLKETRQMLGLPFDVIRRRLDNGGGHCKHLEIYWADTYLATRAAAPQHPLTQETSR